MRFSKKKIALFLITASLVSFTNAHQKEDKYDVPQKIIVAGKIDNYDPSKEVLITINNLGVERENIVAKADSTGNFIAIFESYIPVDAWVMYKTNFLVLLHPNDSLFVHFDGKHNDRPKLLETIRFGGNPTKINQHAAKFQQMYYSNEIYYDWDKKRKAVKEYDIDQYLQYLDTLQQKGKNIYNQFIAENNPDDESKNWAQLYIENEYYDYIKWYAQDHRETNNMGWDNPWDVPKGFYDRLCNRLPIKPSMFIGAFTLRSFSEYFSKYVYDKLRDRPTGDGWGYVPGVGIAGSVPIVDSLVIFSTIEFVTDPLLLQIMLTRVFDRKFEKQEIAVYEKYRSVIDTYIKEPFLKEPLHRRYLQTKLRIENPQVYTEAVMKETVNLSVNQIMNEILLQNKGKVIYIDFWGTWCAPCLGEFPNSKLVEHELKDENIAFVYVCIQSDEKRWKATLDQFQLGGQHYFLSNKQSSEMNHLLEITGYPFYLLIDKNGVIKEKGSHLRPLFAKDKIKEMLK